MILRKETGDCFLSCASSTTQNLDGVGNRHPLEIELFEREKVECLPLVEYTTL